MLGLDAYQHAQGWDQGDNLEEPIEDEDETGEHPGEVCGKEATIALNRVVATATIVFLECCLLLLIGQGSKGPLTTPGVKRSEGGGVATDS